MVLAPHLLLRENPSWRELLDEYSAREAALATDDDPWIPRIQQFADWSGEQLAQVHGRLIAHDLLEFDITDRIAGMRYRVTRTARLAVSTPKDEDNDRDMAA